jgi:nitrogen-specific signal transduction histidine kinase
MGDAGEQAHDDGALISITAHAMLNRISVINGAVALLRRHERSEDDSELIGIIDRESKAIIDLLDNLVRGQPERH